MRLDQRLLVLDGNARLAAAIQIQLPDLLVQVMPPNRQLDPLKIYPLAALNVTDEEVRRVTEGAFFESWEQGPAALEMRHRDGSCRRYFPPSEDPKRLWETYLALVSALRGVADVETVPKLSAWDHAGKWPAGAQALLVPPPLPLAVLGRLVAADILLPWGALDTTLSRRILGLNLSLDVLRANEPPSEKTAFVRELVRLRQSERRIHYYDSPVYIFED
jgi:hypothetical protein